MSKKRTPPLVKKVQQLEGRILAMEALFNVLLRELGNPPEKVMAYLLQVQDRVIATALPQAGISDSHMEGLQHQLHEAVAALQGRIDFPGE